LPAAARTGDLPLTQFGAASDSVALPSQSVVERPAKRCNARADTAWKRESSSCQPH